MGTLFPSVLQFWGTGEHYSPKRFGEHTRLKIMSVLVFDNFGVEHLNKNNTDHLSKALKDKHENVEAKLEGDKLYGINLKWNYNDRTCQVNMTAHADKLQQRNDNPAL